MSCQALPHEVAELDARLPGWLPPCFARAVALASHGPVWLPRWAKRCPLQACVLLMRLIHGWGAR